MEICGRTQLSESSLNEALLPHSDAVQSAGGGEVKALGLFAKAFIVALGVIEVMVFFGFVTYASVLFFSRGW